MRESDAAEAVAQSVERAGQDAEVAGQYAEGRAHEVEKAAAPRKAGIRSTRAERGYL